MVLRSGFVCVQDWDILCIHELQAAQQAAGHPSVVLSTYPLGYDGEGPAAAIPDAAPATLLCAKEFDDAGLLRVQSRWAMDYGCYWAACCVFCCNTVCSHGRPPVSRLQKTRLLHSMYTSAVACAELHLPSLQGLEALSCALYTVLAAADV